MTCECITTLITFLGFLIALLPIFIGLKQYKNENRFKKANYFNDLRNKFKTNPVFNEIRERINNGQNLDQFTQTQLYDYAGFFEELQIAINSKFIKPIMVYYLFGHYILDFADNNDGRVQIGAPLWVALNELVNTMREINNQQLNNEELKF